MMPSDETMHGPLVDTTTAENIIGRKLGVNPEIRRAKFLAFMSLVLLDIYALVLGATAQFWAKIGPVGDPDATQNLWLITLLTAFLAAAGSFMWFLSKLTWLRVTEEGLEVRRILGWDCWSWERFASGGVSQKVGSSVFIDKSKPLTRRKLDLEWYEDARGLFELLASCYARPAIDVPSSVSIRQGLRRISLSAEGITVKRGWQASGYDWSDVSTLTIVRTNHYQRGFRQLRIMVKDRPIILDTVTRQRGGRARPKWAGPPADVVEAFLRQFVLEDKIRVSALLGPVLTVDDLDERIAHAGKMCRRVVLVLFLWASMIVASVSFQVYKGDLSSLDIAPIALLLFVLPLAEWWTRRQALERQREAFLRQEAAKTGEDTHALEE